MTIADAAQALIIERFEQAPEMWADGYSWEVEYDQITIFLDIGEEHVMESHIIFYDEHATLRGHKQGIPTLRFEYANPAFDDLLIDTLKKRLHI